MPANDPQPGETWALIEGSNYEVLEVYNDSESGQRMIRLRYPNGVEGGQDYERFLEIMRLVPPHSVRSVEETEEINQILERLAQHFGATNSLEVLRNLERIAREENGGYLRIPELPEPQASMEMDAVQWDRTLKKQTTWTEAELEALRKVYEPPPPAPTQWERLNEEDE
jgi:hypothetical protein